MRRDRQSPREQCKYRCLLAIVSRSPLNREGQECTNDINNCAGSSGVVVVVHKVVAATVSAQLLKRGDPSKTPGSAGPVGNRSEFDWFPRVKEENTLSHGIAFVRTTILLNRSDI